MIDRRASRTRRCVRWSTIGARVKTGGAVRRQFRTTLDGLGSHFLHVRSRHPNALAIVMTHGWPGSIVEFMEIGAPLTDPTAHGGRAQDAFHFVAPSLPGFGFFRTSRPRAAGTPTVSPGRGAN